MGCVSSKLAPEGPDGVDNVEKIMYQPDHGHNDKSRADKYRENHSQKKNKSAFADEELVRQPANKVAKYRAKFDPRVTAKYDIKALIGRGSFSRVVRVEHRKSRQPYAIKMIDKQQGKEVCESELSVLRRVRHAYIIQLIEVFESRDKVYMVMQLATGGELFDRIISKGTFLERDATRVLSMVLDGVKYLHSIAITHRDLKPENLLYYHPGQDSKILITDFGLSAFRKSTDTTGGLMRTICGTPEYIAPEILARRPYNHQVSVSMSSNFTMLFKIPPLPLETVYISTVLFLRVDTSKHIVFRE